MQLQQQGLLLAPREGRLPRQPRASAEHKSLLHVGLCLRCSRHGLLFLISAFKKIRKIQARPIWLDTGPKHATHEPVVIKASVTSFCDVLAAMLKRAYAKQKRGSPAPEVGFGQILPTSGKWGKSRLHDRLQIKRYLYLAWNSVFSPLKKPRVYPGAQGRASDDVLMQEEWQKRACFETPPQLSGCNTHSTPNDFSPPKKMTVQCKLFWTELLNQNLRRVNTATRKKRPNFLM